MLLSVIILKVFKGAYFNLYRKRVNYENFYNRVINLYIFVQFIFGCFRD